MPYIFDGKCGRVQATFFQGWGGTCSTPNIYWQRPWHEEITGTSQIGSIVAIICSELDGMPVDFDWIFPGFFVCVPETFHNAYHNSGGRRRLSRGTNAVSQHKLWQSSSGRLAYFLFLGLLLGRWDVGCPFCFCPPICQFGLEVFQGFAVNRGRGFNFL